MVSIGPQLLRGGETIIILIWKWIETNFSWSLPWSFCLKVPFFPLFNKNNSDIYLQDNIKKKKSSLIRNHTTYHLSFVVKNPPQDSDIRKIISDIRGHVRPWPPVMSHPVGAAAAQRCVTAQRYVKEKLKIYITRPVNHQKNIYVICSRLWYEVTNRVMVREQGHH